MGQSNSRGVQSSSSLHRRRSGLPAVTVTPPTPTTSPTPLSPTAAAITAKERRRGTSYTSSFRRRKDSKKKSSSSKASSSSLGIPLPPDIPQPELPSGSSSSSSSSSAAVASSSSSSSRHRTRSTPNYGASSSTSTSSHPSSSSHRHSADMGLGINHGALSLAAPPPDATPPKRSSFRKSIMNLVRPTSLFETKSETREGDRSRTQSLTRTTAVEKPIIAPPVVIEEPHPTSNNNNDSSNDAQEGNGEADGIEEVPRLTTTALAPNPTEKGKSKQPASDVPQDAISIASGSVSDEPSTAARHIHHTPSQSDERQELQLTPVIGGAADSESTPAVAYREGGDEEANNLGAGTGQTSDRTRLGREGEHAVTSWLEEELQRVEESSSSSAALGGSDQTIPEPPSSSSSAPIMASASASSGGLDGLPALGPISNPSPRNLSSSPSSPTPAASPSNMPASPNTGTGTPRHFPPPGTLVVVQGIVHTSDAPPTASSSPSASTSNEPSPSSSPQSRPPTARADSDSTASSASNVNETSTGNTTPDHVAAGEGEEARRPVPPAISNGSIDVLGTLLSVAASATAASLLTGNAPTWNATPLDPSRGPQSFPSPVAAANALRASPNPFRSGAQPNSPSANSNPFSTLTSNPGNARNRLMHHPRPPTPSPVGEGGQEGGHVGRAERLRMAWGTIRERLGLGSGSTRSASGSGDTTPTGNGNATPLPSILNPSTTTPWAPNTHTASPNTRLGSPNTTDAGSSPRDVMLAEMARAFNIGLGLDANPSGNSGLIQSSVNAAGGVRPDPAAAAAAASPSSPASASTVPAPSSLDAAASTSTVTPESATQRDANGNPLPSPGSFDRFLHDIQADLRLALTPPNEEEVERGEREDRERAERERAERERVERERLEVLERVERQRAEVLERLDRLRRGEEEWWDSQRVAAERERRDREQGRGDDGVVDPTVQQLREYQERHRQRELLEQQQQQHDSEDEEEFGDMPTLAEISDESEDEESVVGDERPARLTVDTAAAVLPTVNTSATLPALDTSATVPPLDGSTTSPAPATATTPTRTPLSLAELSVPSTTGSGTTALGSGRIDVTGRINWWRMYRFPAVTSVPGAAGARSPPISPSSPTANAATFPAPTPSSAVHPAAAPPPVLPGGVSATAPAGTLLPNFPAPAAGQPVVPVIVVGLQSVNSAWQQEELANIAAAAGGPEAASAIRRSSIAGSPTLASPASGGVLGGGAGRGVPASPSPPPLSPIQRPQSPTSPVSPTNTTSTSSSGRRRRERRVWTQEEIEASPFGWPPMDWDEDESDEEEDDEEAEEEQAQRRIDEQQRRREERSAYRSSRATTESLDLPSLLDSPSSPSDPAAASPDANAANASNAGGAGGARTFLIYVVGGYYPPDHTIVTGGLDNFESFEALLELAEMLGHAKPPTVTKEDIDKSGLETIKPSQLSQYEDEGRVSYNCIERCLICLDDYEEEDDIRIMSCRHAFHKDCVDKWLQTGKNNCPACRSTGVNSS